MVEIARRLQRCGTYEPKYNFARVLLPSILHTHQSHLLIYNQRRCQQPLASCSRRLRRRCLNCCSEIANEWLTECLSTHQGARVLLRRNSLHVWLISVKSATNSAFSLPRVPKGKYVTLSHCWGKADDFCLYCKSQDRGGWTVYRHWPWHDNQASKSDAGNFFFEELSFRRTRHYTGYGNANLWCSLKRIWERIVLEEVGQFGFSGSIWRGNFLI